MPINGAKDFLIFKVVILDNILSSVSSINPVILECLNIESNFCKVSVLKFVNVDNTSAFKVSDDFVVLLASYLIVDVNRIDVISGSTITGVTEATLYFFKSFTISDFVWLVNVEPEAALIPILTIPYLGVSSSSPPHALTDNALG